MAPTSRTAPPAARAQRGAAGPVPMGHAPTIRETVAPANDASEHEADRIAEAVLRGRRWHRPGQGGWSAASEAGGDPAPIRRSPKAVDAATPTPAPALLLVGDDAELTRGQMRKSDFMSALRAGICASVDAALAGTGRDSQGCPWIEHWLGYYEARSAADIERALLRYAPEAAGASSAAQCIGLVTARVSQSARRWAKTGELTGLPEEMPGAGGAGGLLAGVGAMFFKPRSGGAHAADPVSVREQLGRGESLGSGLRARMEGAFGTSFAAVRLHTDGTAARLSNQLNARAFAVGPHVAFGGGEFQPGTPAGDALIAHELAHVVQQGHAVAAPDRESMPAAGAVSEALERDADRSAAGAAAALWGAGSFAELRREARPRLRSGLGLQRCAKDPKPVSSPQVKVKLTPAQERQESLSGASERLRDVNKWVSYQQKAQGVPSVKGVSNLDGEQAGNVATAIELLTKASALSGAKSLDELRPKLKEVVDQAQVAKHPNTGYGGQQDAMASQHALNLAITASNELDELVVKLSASLDMKGIKKDTDAIATALAGAQADPGSIFDAKDKIDKAVGSIRKQILEIQSRDTETPKAMQNVLFVLRSFLALNAPARAKPPTDDEIKAFTSGARGNLAHDFDVVFGQGKEVHGFDAFLLYADLLEKQLAVRAQMAAAKVDAAPIPTQGNAEDFFKSLKPRKNDQVFQAYQDYAAAFFFHGHVASLADMNVTDVSELYQRPLSIFGLRRLVCTGYALLGAHLLGKAGAVLKEFVVAVRATDQDIATDRIDEGHALAHVVRDGKNAWVSNGLIVSSEAGGIGPDAVAWEKSKAPLRTATGPTINEANQRLAELLARLRDAPPKRPAAGGPKRK